MESSHQQSVRLRQNHVFTTTRWSVVISAGRNSSPDSKRALESLCETYWCPLYAYRELLREEIAQTVSGPDEVDDEIRNLFASLEL